MNFFTWNDNWFYELGSYTRVLDTCTQEDFGGFMAALRVFTSLADCAIDTMLAGHAREEEIRGWGVLAPTEGFTVAAEDLHAVLVDTISGVYPREVDRVLCGITARDRLLHTDVERYLRGSDGWERRWNGDWFHFDTRRTMAPAEAVAIQNAIDASKIRAYDLMMAHRQHVADQRHEARQNRDYDELGKLLETSTGKTTQVTIVLPSQPPQQGEQPAV